MSSTRITEREVMAFAARHGIDRAHLVAMTHHAQAATPLVLAEALACWLDVSLSDVIEGARRGADGDVSRCEARRQGNG